MADNIATAQQQMTILRETGLDRLSSTLIVELGGMFVENIVERKINGNSGYYLQPLVDSMTPELFALHAAVVPTIHSNGADFQSEVSAAVWYQTPCNAEHYHNDFEYNQVHPITYNGTEGEMQQDVQSFTEFDPVELTNVDAPHSPIMLSVRFYWDLTCVDVFPQFIYSWEDDEGVYEYESQIYVNVRLLCPELTINSHPLFK